MDQQQQDENAIDEELRPGHKYLIDFLLKAQLRNMEEQYGPDGPEMFMRAILDGDLHPLVAFGATKEEIAAYEADQGSTS